MATLGDLCISRESEGFNNYTLILTKYAFAAGATITNWCIYAVNAGTVKLKVFRDNGTYFVLVGESNLESVSAGLNSFSTSISGILTGDYIGCYVSGSGGANVINYTPGSDTPIYYIGSTDAGTTLKSSFTLANFGPVSFNATYTAITTYDNVYIDINKADDTGDGVAFATAKKTMKAGWDILNALGTMHVATGDYSAQATIAYNKSWELSPEDPNSTGVKSVRIPKST